MKKKIILLALVAGFVIALTSCQLFTGRETNIPDATNLPGLEEVGASGKESSTPAETASVENTTSQTFQTTGANQTETPTTACEETTAQAVTTTEQTAAITQTTAETVSTTSEETAATTREHVHVVIETWIIKATEHFKLCGTCNEILDRGNHEWELVNIVQKGSETEPSIHRVGCEICHHTKLIQYNADGTTIDMWDNIPVS